MENNYNKIIFLFTKMIAIFIAIIFVISILKKMDIEKNLQSDGTVSPVTKEEICTPEDYLEFAEKVNSGNDYQNCEVSLQANLNFYGYDNVIPVGTVGEEGRSFRGTFNGNGYTISGVTMERPGDYAGLFVNL